MHWIIDGNNLMHLLPEIIWTTPAAGQPAALAALVKPYRDAKSLKLTIYFDGGQQAGSARLSGVPVFFAGPEQSADEAILQRLGKEPGLGLVSNDRGLQNAAKNLGARVADASVFANKLKLSQGYEDDENGWNFSTRKKGPSRRLPKSKRKQNSLLQKL